VGIGSTNDGFAWHGGVVTRNYVANGLNQYATVGPNAWTYDGRGNLMSNTADSYTYDPQNRLLTASGPTAVTLTYDPIGHLQTTASAGATTTFLYAGDMLVGEYDASGNILRRYVPGPGVDEPVVWYEGAGTSDRRWLHADTAGSVIGYSDATGASDATYAYDPYGLPDSWTATGAARYRYTGQLMIPEAHLYYYKARMYDPQNGRFLQTDPVGYQSDINLYAYVGNDPINGWDPSGMDVGGIYTEEFYQEDDPTDVAPVYVPGAPPPPPPPPPPDPNSNPTQLPGDLSLIASPGTTYLRGFTVTARPARGAAISLLATASTSGPQSTVSEVVVTASRAPQIMQIAANGQPPRTGRAPTTSCPGLGGQPCGAPTGAGGVNPDYPDVCPQCLDRNRKWPYTNQPPPDSLKYLPPALLLLLILALSPVGA
jgi:RHS repeat-associated protein